MRVWSRPQACPVLTPSRCADLIDFLSVGSTDCPQTDIREESRRKEKRRPVCMEKINLWKLGLLCQDACVELCQLRSQKHVLGTEQVQNFTQGGEAFSGTRAGGAERLCRCSLSVYGFICVFRWHQLNGRTMLPSSLGCFHCGNKSICVLDQ